MAKKDGGHAFPTTAYWEEKPFGVDEGMTLRDYFAAKALQGLVASPVVNLISNDAYAQRAYQYADAMIAEREK